MIHTKTLIMSPQQSDLAKIRDCPADIASAGAAHPLTNLILNDAIRLVAIGRKRLGFVELCTDRFYRQAAARVALGHWDERIAQPVPDWHGPAIDSDVGTCTSPLIRNLSDQLEQHVAELWARRRSRDNCQERRGIHPLAGICRRFEEVCLMEHSMNLGDLQTNVNP